MSLINTLEAPGEFDAMASLRPGEPYFLLVGRDKLAPTLVLQWAQANRRRTMDEHDRELIDEETYDLELRKSTQAEVIAWSMQSYKRGDPPVDRDTQRASATVSYSGHELPEDTLRRDKIQRYRARSANALSVAIGEISGVVELLLDEGEEGIEKGKLNAEIGRLMKLGDKIVPKRPDILKAR